MTYALIALELLTIAAFLWFLREERYQHARDLAQQAKDHEIERDKLLNRIQAPELAVAQTWVDPDPEPKHIPLEDDDQMTDYFRDRRLNGGT